MFRDLWRGFVAAIIQAKESTMKFIDTPFLVAISILMFFGHQCISYAIARNALLSLLYGIVAVLALLAVVFIAFGLR